VGEDENVLGPRDTRWRMVWYLTGTNWWSGTLLLIVTCFEMLCCDVAQPLHIVAMLWCIVLIMFSFMRLVFEQIRLELWNAAGLRAQLSLLVIWPTTRIPLHDGMCYLPRIRTIEQRDAAVNCGLRFQCCLDIV